MENKKTAKSPVAHAEVDGKFTQDSQIVGTECNHLEVVCSDAFQNC